MTTDAADEPRVKRIPLYVRDGVATLERPDERDEEIARLRAHTEEQIAFVESRIQDGREMGASIWRIALEDVARENRIALQGAGRMCEPART